MSMYCAVVPYTVAVSSVLEYLAVMDDDAAGAAAAISSILDISVISERRSGSPLLSKTATENILEPRLFIWSVTESVAPETRELVKVTEECFFKGLEFARVGYRISDISAAIQAHAEAHGYGVVRDMIGHGIGRDMHEAPDVPNYTGGRYGRGIRLMAGMTIAIEPMINMGTWQIKVLSDGWTAVTADGKPSAHYENTVAITDGGPIILTLSEGSHA